MQGGYEPRGSDGPGRGIYLVRRAVFILIAIVLFAFVLPRACGAFSGPDTTDSEVPQSETERADAPSGGDAGSSGDSSNDISEDVTGGLLPSEGSETGSDDTANTEDEPAEDGSDEGSSEDDGESAMPDTVEEKLEVEEPKQEAPSGIPTTSFAAQRVKRADKPKREDPARLRSEVPMTTLTLRSVSRNVEPVSDEVDEVSEQVEDVSETVPVDQPVEPSNPQQVTDASRASVAETMPGTAVRRSERIARSGNNVALAPGGGTEDGGSAATSVRDARRVLNDVSRGGARAAVRGALNDARASVSATESLDEARNGKKDKQRCGKKPERCVVDQALLK